VIYGRAIIAFALKEFCPQSLWALTKHVILSQIGVGPWFSFLSQFLHWLLRRYNFPKYLVKGICLMYSCLILWSSIWIGCSSNTRLSMTAMGLVMTVWLGSEMYCLHCEARNTLCTCLSYIGRSSRHAMKFNLLIDLYGQTDIWLNLAHNSNFLIPLVEETFEKKLIIHLKL